MQSNEDFMQTTWIQRAAVAALCAAACVAFAKDGGIIKGSGCVEAGVEAGCLVVGKNKKAYNLVFGSGEKAKVGTAIAFEGTVHTGPSFCMQGTSVNVTKWRETRRACPKPKG